MDVRLMVEQFRRVSGALMARPGIPAEAAYRIRKMMDRVAPVADKVYLKTLKGGEMLLQCTEKAGIIGEHLNGDEDLLYLLLTDLETTCEELLKGVYEFRIKAG